MDRRVGPAMLGTFLRSFSFGHARQLDAVASRLLVNLAARAPLLVGADQFAYPDIDDTIPMDTTVARRSAPAKLPTEVVTVEPGAGERRR